MKNEEAIAKFLKKEKAQTPKRKIQNGYYTYEGHTLVSDGKILINYKTTIAKHCYDVLYLNNSKYSVTTSKIQNELKRQAEAMGFNIRYCSGDEIDNQSDVIILGDDLQEG